MIKIVLDRLAEARPPPSLANVLAHRNLDLMARRQEATVSTAWRQVIPTATVMPAERSTSGT